MKLFLAASTSGLMPGGNRAELPLFPEAEMPLVSTKKYAEWAPEPFDTLPGPQGIVGAPAESPPPLMRWMLIMSGMDAIMAEALGSRTPPLTVERSFKSVKTKVRSEGLLSRNAADELGLAGDGARERGKVAIERPRQVRTR